MTRPARRRPGARPAPGEGAAPAGGDAAARLLAVRVSPGAARSEVLGFAGETLRVRVREAPEGGRANRAVQALLARALGLPPSAVALVRGEAGRDKLFRVGALSAAQARARLEGAS